jgi:hypothetical protein
MIFRKEIFADYCFVLTICRSVVPAALPIFISVVCLLNMFVVFVQFSAYTATISLNSKNQLIFIAEISLFRYELGLYMLFRRT